MVSFLASEQFVGEPSSGLEAARSVGGRASAGAVARLNKTDADRVLNSSLCGKRGPCAWPTLET